MVAPAVVVLIVVVADSGGGGGDGNCFGDCDCGGGPDGGAGGGAGAGKYFLVGHLESSKQYSRIDAKCSSLVRTRINSFFIQASLDGMGTPCGT